MVRSFQSELVLRWATNTHLDGAHFVPFGVLHVGFSAIQLHGVRHADEIDVIDGHGESECHLIARLRDLQRERLGRAFLAVYFLAVETPGSEQRFGSGVNRRGEEGHGRGQDQCSSHLLLLSFTQKMS